MTFLTELALLDPAQSPQIQSPILQRKQSSLYEPHKPLLGPEE
jgi:hypothetical protein